MIYMSERFLRTIKGLGGFWFDEKNGGYVTGEEPHKREAMGCYGYNAGITYFHQQAKETGLDVHHKIYMPSIDMGIRGVI